MDDELSRISVHEAGHAALAVVQGLGFKGARLDKSGPDFGGHVLLDHRLNRIVGRAVDEQVRFLLGGFLADRRFNTALCSRENSAADFEKAVLLLKSFPASQHEQQWHRLLTEADLLVAQYRTAIQNVANELLEREVLNPMQIASIIRRSR